MLRTTVAIVAGHGHARGLDPRRWAIEEPSTVERSDVPSPTLRLHLRVSHEMVVVGGGKHTADELRAFAAYGKPIRYVPARMNEAATQRWCREVGMASPDPYGAARLAWQEVGARACVEQGDGGRSQPAGATR